MKIYNSLSRTIEDFTPMNPPKVNIYTCGPTVYYYAHIGNWRTYVTADILVRTLKYLGHEANYVMNLTDVGHLTGDNTGDADTGEDRLEKAAKRELKSAWDIATFYGDKFMDEFGDLNLTRPSKFPKATDHIPEQIALIEKLQKNGLTYKTADGVYFDTKKYEEITGRKYGELSNLDKIKEGARVKKNVEKKNPRDFALWKFSKGEEKRHMEWESPWGVGFPGWHIECSAMSMKYLGETLDIHVGGEDLRSTHHPNEIAQSEGATGKTFVKYWVHAAFLKVDGGRMGKSLGNAYNLSDITKRGISPMALKLFYYSSHYRDSLNFTWEALRASQNALDNLYERTRELHRDDGGNGLSSEKLEKVDNFQSEFRGYLENDLDMPKALAVVWSALKSNIPSPDKLDLLYDFDDVLGLNLRGIGDAKIPREIDELVKERETYREKGDYKKADEMRKKIEIKGFILNDSGSGTSINKK